MVKLTRKSHAIFVIPIFVALLSFGLAGRSNAEDGSFMTCGPSESQPYSAVVDAPTDTYDVFGRLGKDAAATDAQVFLQNNTTCNEVGKTPLTVDRWQKIGTITVGSELDSTLLFYSDTIQGLPDANRPSLMLVSQTDPVCEPTTECYVTVDGANGYVRPTGTLFNEDSLHVVRVVDPAKDTIKSVEYYVGAKLAYTKPTLEPFDKRYLEDREPNISRVIVYASGQKVILPDTTQTSYANSYERTLFKTAKGNRLAIIASVVLVASLAIMWLSLTTARWLYAKHRWKQLHVTATPKQPANETQATPNEPIQVSEPHFTHETPWWVKTAKYGLYTTGIVVVAGYVVLMLGTYIIQPYQVDGVSMQSTLATGQQLLVNKTGKTWASLNGGEYIPKRGEIIVFQKAQRTDISLGIADSPDKEYVVKRVIGLPGDRVTVINGTITVYTKDKPEGFNPDSGAKWERNIFRSEDDKIDVTLTGSQVFVVGDNRPESVDSRFNGPVEAQYIVGDVFMRLSPLNTF